MFEVGYYVQYTRSTGAQALAWTKPAPKPGPKPAPKPGPKPAPKSAPKPGPKHVQEFKMHWSRSLGFYKEDLIPPTAPDQ